MVTVLVLVACSTAGPPATNSVDTDTGTADSGDTTLDTGDTGTRPDTGDSGDSGDTAPDPATLDQDGDGYTPNDGDCDDARAHIHPGAPDACDGLDQDCDGEPIPDHSCGETWLVGEMWSWSIEGDGTLDIFDAKAGDVTGDSVGDVVVDGLVATDVYFGVYGPAVTWPAVTVLAGAFATDDFPTWDGLGYLPIVDSTGDGVGDAWLLALSGSGYTGGAFLYPGGPGGFGAAGTRFDSSAQAWWVDGDGVAFDEDDPRVGVGDLTGDGLADVELLAKGRDGGTRLTYIAGEPAVHGAHTAGSLPQMFVDETDYRLYGQLVGDLDGDGLAESAFELVGAEGDPIAFLAGADWIDGATFADVASLAYDGSGAALGSTTISLLFDAPPGDVDGDGLQDVVLNTHHADGSKCAELLSGGVPGGDLNAWSYAQICPGYAMDWVADLDDDGSADVGTSEGMVPSTLLRGGGTLSADAVTPLHPESPEYILQATADLDGDGRAEWILGDQHYDDGRARLLIVRGFDIPWDDPAKW